MNFNNPELNNQNYEFIFKKLNENYETINSGGGLDLENIEHKKVIQDIYIFSSLLKQKNEQKIKELSETMDIIDENNSKIKKKTNTLDMEDIKDNFSKTNAQNNQNMKSFLEKYLYIIIKIVFIIVLLFLAMRLSSYTIFSFSLTTIFSKLLSKFNFFNSKVTNTENIKIENKQKIENIKIENKKVTKIIIIIIIIF